MAAGWPRTGPTRPCRSSARRAPSRASFQPTAVQFPVAGQDTPVERSVVLGGHGGPLPAVPVLGQGHAGRPGTHRHAVLGPGAGDAGRLARHHRGRVRLGGPGVAVPALAQQPGCSSCCRRSRPPRRRWTRCRTRRRSGCRPAGCRRWGWAWTARPTWCRSTARPGSWCSCRCGCWPARWRCTADRPVQDTPYRTAPLRTGELAAAAVRACGVIAARLPLPWPGPRGSSRRRAGLSSRATARLTGVLVAAADGPPRAVVAAWAAGAAAAAAAGPAATIAPTTTTAVIPARLITCPAMPSSVGSGPPESLQTQSKTPKPARRLAAGPSVFRRRFRRFRGDPAAGSGRRRDAARCGRAPSGCSSGHCPRALETSSYSSVRCRRGHVAHLLIAGRSAMIMGPGWRGVRWQPARPGSGRAWGRMRRFWWSCGSWLAWF